MSLILDALSRAEREKREEANPAPGILAQETPPHPLTGRGWNNRGPLLAMGVFAIVLALAVFMMPGSPTTPFVPKKSDEVVARPANQASNKMATQADSAVGDRQSPPPDTRVTAQQSAGTARALTPKQDAAIAALYAQPAENANDVSNAPISASSGGQAETQSEGQTQVATSLSESEIDVEQVLRQVRAKAANSALQPHPTPLLDDLTKQFKDSVPTLMYSRHDYSGAGSSTVTINGTSLTPGQRTRGVEVLDILGDSVILRFEGNAFRLRALNSWVNL